MQWCSDRLLSLFDPSNAWAQPPIFLQFIPWGDYGVWNKEIRIFDCLVQCNSFKQSNWTVNEICHSVGVWDCSLFSKWNLIERQLPANFHRDYFVSISASTSSSVRESFVLFLFPSLTGKSSSKHPTHLNGVLWKCLPALSLAAVDSCSLNWFLLIWKTTKRAAKTPPVRRSIEMAITAIRPPLSTGFTGRLNLLHHVVFTLSDISTNIFFLNRIYFRICQAVVLSTGLFSRRICPHRCHRF